VIPWFGAFNADGKETPMPHTPKPYRMLRDVFDLALQTGAPLIVRRRCNPHQLAVWMAVRAMIGDPPPPPQRRRVDTAMRWWATQGREDSLVAAA
jgi:hypothetical protein